MQALGFIEVRGKVAAIEAADTCLKSANIKLIGCELTTGALITVKIEGDVGAVNSAISAAKARYVVQNQLIATLVIPRPSKGISSMTELEATRQVISEVKIGYSENNSENEIVNDHTSMLENRKVEDHNKDTADAQKISTVINISIDKSDKVKAELEKNNDVNDTDEQSVTENQESEDGNKFTCNLCRDPMCLRKRGQPKNLCMHYKDKMESAEGDINYDVK
ncbi:BMC domain-containing protein [Clostridium thailandense]|uniref:BMC domain-containing protein n=1 Tax=Clostridium thailandense TaxID=2794346 RepID=UPI00398A4631